MVIDVFDNSPYWLAQIAQEMGERFIREFPDHLGWRQTVLFTVTRGSEKATIAVWRTPVKKEVKVQARLESVNGS